MAKEKESEEGRQGEEEGEGEGKGEDDECMLQLPETAIEGNGKRTCADT